MSNSCRPEKPTPIYIGCDVLTQGCMDEEHFLLLMDISPICSKKVFESLRAYLVDGRSRKFICENYNINNGYLTVSLNRLNKIHQCLFLLKKYY
ncbi:TPA: PapB/FocB family fimbrial expression transcriptional regulator [Escherichia coli]|uniref:PapB/FocB family fimbrial expression transcriptional regulator n=1 Tax=Escherichia coli TaxID=562 RepID=UPI00025C7E2D|nr:PapB/FocB family fimbrial expression transcriptional regulator [Escherichia coli]EII1282223.1 transcriptional regulator [Escherichia coli O157]EJT2769118.1 transcriptional regulator [Shigella sonnei]EKF4807066.1 transcriptional regulator [Escherichia coli O91]ATO79357.1 transcriptional regulator [Escherichia coli O91 str. RM7190]EEQ9810321.1 transcriptional regulator [Escherichia coli]